MKLSMKMDPEPVPTLRNANVNVIEGDEFPDKFRFCATNEFVLAVNVKMSEVRLFVILSSISPGSAPLLISKLSLSTVTPAAREMVTDAAS